MWHCNWNVIDHYSQVLLSYFLTVNLWTVSPNIPTKMYCWHHQCHFLLTSIVFLLKHPKYSDEIFLSVLKKWNLLALVWSTQFYNILYLYGTPIITDIQSIEKVQRSAAQWCHLDYSRFNRVISTYVKWTPMVILKNLLDCQSSTTSINASTIPPSQLYSNESINTSSS